MVRRARNLLIVSLSYSRDLFRVPRWSCVIAVFLKNLFFISFHLFFILMDVSIPQIKHVTSATATIISQAHFVQSIFGISSGNVPDAITRGNIYIPFLLTTFNPCIFAYAHFFHKVCFYSGVFCHCCFTLLATIRLFYRRYDLCYAYKMHMLCAGKTLRQLFLLVAANVSLQSFYLI